MSTDTPTPSGRSENSALLGDAASTVEAQRESASRILESHGITPTAQRVEIARILLARPQHLSAEQVLSCLKEGDLSVSKATVYNTLGLFAQKGLVREVIVDPSKVFYDSNRSEHHHFYDVDSCILTDIDAADIDVGGLPQAPDGKLVDRVDVIIRVRSRED